MMAIEIDIEQVRRMLTTGRVENLFATREYSARGKGPHQLRLALYAYSSRIKALALSATSG